MILSDKQRDIFFLCASHLSFDKQNSAPGGPIGNVATATGTTSSQGLRIAIEWGDGTVSKLLLASEKSRITVKGSHTYGQAGIYTIIVIIEDLGTGEQAHASGTATVS